MSTINRGLKVAIAIAVILVLGSIYFFWRLESDPIEPVGGFGVVAAAPLASKPSPSASQSPTVTPPPDEPFVMIRDTGTVPMPVPTGLSAGPNAQCRGRTFTAGNSQYHAHHRAYWCYTTGKNRHLIQDDRSGWGTVNQPGWTYGGYVVGARTGCVGGQSCHWSFYRLVYDFYVCATWGCEHDYPWIQMTVRDDGTSTVGWGGGG